MEPCGVSAMQPAAATERPLSHLEMSSSRHRGQGHLITPFPPLGPALCTDTSLLSDQKHTKINQGMHSFLFIFFLISLTISCSSQHKI